MIENLKMVLFLVIIVTMVYPIAILIGYIIKPKDEDFTWKIFNNAYIISLGITILLALVSICVIIPIGELLGLL